MSKALEMLMADKLVAKECRQRIRSHKYIQQICSVAVYDEVFFAYRVATPRQRFNFSNVFQLNSGFHRFLGRTLICVYDFSWVELLPVSSLNVQYLAHNSYHIPCQRANIELLYPI